MVAVIDDTAPKLAVALPAEEAWAAGRYVSLDAWRGAAALAVVVFHSLNTLVPPERSSVVALLLHGWAGVFVFFPISGYCILAATERHTRGAWAFLKRRWRRIFPTYWFSVVFAVGLLLLLAPLSHGSLSSIDLGAKWLSVATLTQTFVGMPQVVNPVYWSLCYEEQFYLIVAGTLLFARGARRWVLLALTALCACAVIGVPRLVLPPGLFVDHWLEFAAGLAVYGWFDRRYGRTWSVAILAMVFVAGAVTRSSGIAVSLGTSLCLLAFRSRDAAAMSSWPIRWLAVVGAFSYSLYLTHVPVAGRIVNLSKRLLPDAGDLWVVLMIVATAASLVVAWTFHVLVERRFQNSRRGLDATVARAA